MNWTKNDRVDLVREIISIEIDSVPDGALIVL